MLKCVLFTGKSVGIYYVTIRLNNNSEGFFIKITNILSEKSSIVDL